MLVGVCWCLVHLSYPFVLSRSFELPVEENYQRQTHHPDAVRCPVATEVSGKGSPRILDSSIRLSKVYPVHRWLPVEETPQESCHITFKRRLPKSLDQPKTVEGPLRPPSRNANRLEEIFVWPDQPYEWSHVGQDSKD